MNKKQCPKCGEENPPEAVMCWACYTPLSGGAAVGGANAGAAGGGASATSRDDGEKKKIPPWQLGVIGVGLLFAVGMGVRAMMPASSNDVGIDPTTDGLGEGDPGMIMPPADSGGVAPPSPGNNNPGSGSSIKPESAPYKIVVKPNPLMSTATMAIVPTDTSTSSSQAASYAAAVRRQFGGQGNKWRTIYIYVFSDEKAAQTFAQIMRQRRGAPLSGGDYASLSSLWSSTLARYEYSGGKEKVLYPSKNPSGWWYGNN